MSYKGPDKLSITRMIVNDRIGIHFAPSERILRHALDERHAGRMEEHWPIYSELYREEMRASYRRHRNIWDEVLAREVVTLACFCEDPLRCHRSLLASFLERLGGQLLGERDPEEDKARPEPPPPTSLRLPFDP